MRRRRSPFALSDRMSPFASRGIRTFVLLSSSGLMFIVQESPQTDFNKLNNDLMLTIKVTLTEYSEGRGE